MKTPEETSLTQARQLAAMTAERDFYKNPSGATIAQEGEWTREEAIEMHRRKCEELAAMTAERDVLRARVAELEKALSAMVDLKDHYEIHPRHRSIVQDAIIALNLTAK